MDNTSNNSEMTIVFSEDLDPTSDREVRFIGVLPSLSDAERLVMERNARVLRKRGVDGELLQEDEVRDALEHFNECMWFCEPLRVYKVEDFPLY
jgi:hypothetical protein